MILFEELESRTMMSAAPASPQVIVTSGQLTTDQNAIVAAKTSYNNTVLALGDSLISGSQTLETELPAGSANLKLEKKAIAAESKVISTLKKETATLEKDSVSLSAKAVLAGDADLAKPTTAANSKVEKAGLLLLKKVNADQAKISNDTSLLNLYTDFNHIIIANPSATTFATGVQNIENAVTLTSVPNAEAGLQTTILALLTDLGVPFI
jgi:hypothetical protein